ncbi:MAG: RIO1 family regulatory kinase/ATPase [Desulfobacterales bacterium]
MGEQITRQVMDQLPAEILSKGRWGNADLVCCRFRGKTWAIKDFSPCPPLVKKTWGRWMVRREYKAFIRLMGISGIPPDPFLLDAYAVGYRFIPGKTLREARAEELPDDFFYRLEDVVTRMHERRIVHLDLRNRRNILVSENGEPVLLDFQSCMDLNYIPRVFHRLLRDVDLSGVYKNWIKLRPELMDETRLAHLGRMNRRRSLWVFKGYPMGTKGKRRE